MKQPAGSMPFNMLKTESLVRVDTTLAAMSDKPFDEVAVCLERSIDESGMTIIAVHEFDRLLAAMGQALPFRCRVYEVFDSRTASVLITLDPGLAHMLPYRIAMHNREAVTTVTTPMPTVALTEFSISAEVAVLARSLEAALRRVLDGLCCESWSER